MARERKAIKMAFRWRADDVPTLNAGLVVLWFSGDPDLSARKSYIFLIFQGRGIQTHVPLLIRACSKAVILLLLLLLIHCVLCISECFDNLHTKWKEKALYVSFWACMYFTLICVSCTSYCRYSRLHNLFLQNWNSYFQPMLLALFLTFKVDYRGPIISSYSSPVIWPSDIWNVCNTLWAFSSEICFVDRQQLIQTNIFM